MVAKGFLAAAAIIICCSTTLQGKDPEEKCASGDCPATCSDKDQCSADAKCSAEGKCNDKEECCEQEQVSLEKCSTEKCSTEKCSTGKCAKSKCSTEKCSADKCSTEKCSAEKCSGEKCAFSACAGGACDSLKCALDGIATSACAAEGTCAKSNCSTATCAASSCAEGQCGESCPVAACAGQVCDALKCALQSCTAASDDDCCPDAVCATGACGTSQCATLECSEQNCAAGACNSAPCSDEVCSGLQCAVGVCLTPSGGQLTFTATKSFAGKPAPEKCSTEVGVEETCSTGKCGTETCATATCATSKCASAKCSSQVCTERTCSTAKCDAEQCSIETCLDKTCATSECSTGKCGKSKCETTERTAGVSELETKLAQLEQLQRDIVELRRTTGAPEQMIVKVTVVEVNCTECRNKGFDFETSSTAGRGDLASQIQRFPALIEALERNNLACIVANPTLAVSSGRPVRFHAGGKALVTDANGNTTEREVGTKVDVLARSIGGNKVRVEIRPEFSQANHALATIESHSVDAAFETTLGTPFVLSDACMSRVKAVTREVEGKLLTKEEVEEIQRLTVVTVEGIGTLNELPAIKQAAYEDALLEKAKQPELVTKVYPVPDLQVWKVRPQGVQFDADLLVAHLKSTVDSQSWRGAVCSSPADAKNANGAIQPFERNGSLVICQTEENHEQIANLLQKMRAEGQQKHAARKQVEAEQNADQLGVTLEMTAAGDIQAHVVAPASAETPVEQESKCSQGKCSESKCQGGKCSKSEVSLESESTDECPGDCQGKCNGDCPETASCPCIGGTCTR
jgi:hypothetical protein